MQKPKIMNNDAGRQVTETFGGINRALKIREGEWNEAVNLTSDQYPMLAARKPVTFFSSVGEYNHVDHMIDKNGLYFIHSNANGDRILTDRGTCNLNLGSVSVRGLVSFGAYILVLGPDIWYNTSDGTHGDINAMFTPTDTDITAAGAQHPYVLKLCPCDKDGNALRIRVIREANIIEEIKAHPDDSPYLSEPIVAGDCLVTVPEGKIERYVGPESEGNPQSWENVGNYLRIEANGLHNLEAEAGDVVEIRGLQTGAKSIPHGLYVDDKSIDDPYSGPLPTPAWVLQNFIIASHETDPNGFHKLTYVGFDEETLQDYIIIEDVLFLRNVTMNYAVAHGARIGREMPDMDFVFEAQNRLWGCKYGDVDGKLINEIYASELGDFKNWRLYDGTSMASWTASVGSDGPWTGAINYNGNPIFFKENRMHKVYPSAYGAHQIREYTIDGVRSGCHKSLCVVENRLYWVGKFGIYVYDGSTPYRIDRELQLNFSETGSVQAAFGGGVPGKVFFELEGDDLGGLYVYDTGRAQWHMLDCEHTILGRLLCPSNYSLYDWAADGTIVDLLGNETDNTEEEEAPVKWSCTSGLIGWGDIEQKYMLHLVLRVLLARGSQMSVWIEYDSDGKWNHAGTLKGTSGATKSYVLPVRPRRCDHFRIRLSGTGDMALYSLSKMYQKGSDVV